MPLIAGGAHAQGGVSPVRVALGDAGLGAGLLHRREHRLGAAAESPAAALQRAGLDVLEQDVVRAEPLPATVVHLAHVARVVAAAAVGDPAGAARHRSTRPLTPAPLQSVWVWSVAFDRPRRRLRSAVLPPRPRPCGARR
ncbi:MAG: hypothetical protein TH68_08360 [Candidatus Synechococcus spongiarum 142]|uniref:Uncharacterized protein n=1 Tax=Candidatus Synechococcus spongiarum 142 TaxID=1608213 RepID=A0A6N3X797_9SYNE|nr:MAG: hypothetical protein TH68_08360 [Candidatus Synechococcus spongiarum 142]